MNRKRVSLAAAFTAAAVAAGAVAVVATSAAAAGTVTASFSTNSWGSGQTGTYKITNDTADTTPPWTVEFDLPAGTAMGAYWDALITTAGNHVVAKGRDYNERVPKGASVTFGFNTTGSGAPTNCKINGAACAAGSGPGGPTTGPTTKPPTNPPTTGPTTPAADEPADHAAPTVRSGRQAARRVLRAMGRLRPQLPREEHRHERQRLEADPHQLRLRQRDRRPVPDR